MVYQCKNLGDSLLATPLLQALLKNDSKSQILVICKPASIDIFEKIHPRVQVKRKPSTLSEWVSLLRAILGMRRRLFILPYPANEGLALAKFTLSRSVSSSHFKHWFLGSPDDFLPNRLSPWRHTVDVNLDILRRLGFVIKQSDKCISTAHLLSDHFSSDVFEMNEGYIVIHPGSRWMFKTPRFSFWEELVERLVASGYSIVVTGGAEGSEKDLCDRLGNLPCVVNAAGRTDLRQLANMISRATGFIGVDTFSMHLAAGLGVPGVVLFGPTSELIWGPYGYNCKLGVVTSNHSCRPCHVDGCGGSKMSDCLETLNPAGVVASFCRQLELC